MQDSEIRKLCEEVEEYCSNATRAPWEEGAYKDGEDGEVRCCVLGFRPSDDDGNAETEVVVAGAEGNTPQDSMDMEFISRARVDLPKLVAALREKLEAERSEGSRMIAEERERQKSKEGWTAEHDNQHPAGDLTQAAICYADNARLQQRWHMHVKPVGIAKDWPWEPRWWKPSSDPVRNLVKAGALIAAEIDRLLALPSAPEVKA